MKVLRPDETTTTWIAVDFGVTASLAVTGLRIQGQYTLPDSVCSIDSFYLEGSPDGLVWTKIVGSQQTGQDTRTQATFTWPWMN